LDAVTLDHVLDEVRPLLLGRHLSRPRLVGATALVLESAGVRDRWLWLDAGRGTAGVYLVPRATGRRLAESSRRDVPGRARQALLHLRKHVGGARLTLLRRVPGERVVILEASGPVVVLRLGGAAPALTLAREGTVLGTLGEGPAAWPPPDDQPEREWDRIDPLAFEAAVAASVAEGRSLRRSVALACPGLGPLLAGTLDGSARSFSALRSRLTKASPTVIGPGPAGSWRAADLGVRDAVALAPFASAREGSTATTSPSWIEAGAVVLEARWRGAVFDRRRRVELGRAGRERRRLDHLEANLERDLAGLADERRLRREGEALLVFGRDLGGGLTSVALDDPYEPGSRLVVSLDPRLGGLQNAQRIFEKARRAERSRRRIEERLRDTRRALAEARERERAVLAARDLEELAPSQADESTGAGPASTRCRRYLTTHGLPVLVGRTARENHHLTFRVARGEDLWLHARDLPGAHVILRDDEGRAAAEDLREAAEVAAFFSEGRTAAHVDVHVTRRKHVRPARGGPGRVFVAHSETLRVEPRDPEGRLRRR
jgi:hypothetical protein